ncbi:MAG TPA: OmpA family protein [Candidatus Acidoferrum sp.]|nr:OmpA family protein [Candidatus Acidoferrum sp.]
MKLIKLMSVIGVIGFLAGCASDIHKMRDVQATGGTPFTQALTEEYRKFVVSEADEMGDWVDANYFSRKGLAAANGDIVLPEELGIWDLPPEKVDELAAARGRLMRALDSGARDSNPQVAATAQARFDCWVEQTEELDEQGSAACRDEFLKAMEELEGKKMATPSEPEKYIVLFDFDKSNINAAAQAVIDQILADAKKMGTVNLSATGHADRAGSENYNMALSLRRADAVRAALIAGGISADAITVAGRGESEPAVPTADGVKEQANRRVEVILQ